MRPIVLNISEIARLLGREPSPVHTLANQRRRPFGEPVPGVHPPRYRLEAVEAAVGRQFTDAELALAGVKVE